MPALAVPAAEAPASGAGDRAEPPPKRTRTTSRSALQAPGAPRCRCGEALKPHWTVCPSCHTPTGIVTNDCFGADRHIGQAVPEYRRSSTLIRLRLGGRTLGFGDEARIAQLGQQLEDEHERFALEHPDYGYSNKGICDIRADDFSRLAGFCYLDFCGSGLYPESTVASIARDLSATIHGNPHTSSDNAIGGYTSEAVEAVRKQALAFVNGDPDEYIVIFTAGASAGAKLVGENFAWTPESVCAHSLSNHNSFIGIREYARKAGSTVVSVPDESLGTFQDPSASAGGDAKCMLIYPAKCNFSGVKFPLDVVSRVRGLSASAGRRWYVFLDCAAYVPEAKLDLQKVKPDFVAISWYKVLGFPTGIGSLVVRRDALSALEKVYFGGGSVTLASPFDDGRSWRKFASHPWSYFEDGTLDFLGIVALGKALGEFSKIPMAQISRHIHCVTQHLYHRLAGLRHANGAKVVEIYGRHDENDFSRQGGVLSFNLLQPNGSYFSPLMFGRSAAVNNFHIRVGQFCNPGAAARWLHLDAEGFATSAESGYSCGAAKDFLAENKPVMAVRVSTGWVTSWEDVEAFAELVQRFVRDWDQSAHEVKYDEVKDEEIICIKEDWANRIKHAGGKAIYVAEDAISPFILSQDASKRRRLVFGCCPEPGCLGSIRCAHMAFSRGFETAASLMMDPHLFPRLPEEQLGTVREVSGEAAFDTEVREAKASGDLLVAKFFASWCPHCHKIKPDFVRMVDSTDGVRGIKVDVDVNRPLRLKCGAKTMPTFAFFKNGIQVGVYSGSDKDQLRAEIDRYRSA